MEQNKDIFDHLKVRKTDSPDASYFENMADQIIASQKKETKVIPLYKKPTLWMSAAAASIIVVLVMNIGGSPGENTNVLLALNDIPVEDIRNYVDNNIDDFDTDLISEFVDENTIEDEPLLPAVEVDPETEVVEDVKELEDVNEDDILKYFEEEEIDIYELFGEESFI